MGTAEAVDGIFLNLIPRREDEEIWQMFLRVFRLVTKSTLKENITKRYNYRLRKSVLKHILDHWFIAEYAKHDNYHNLLVFSQAMSCDSSFRSTKYRAFGWKHRCRKGWMSWKVPIICTTQGAKGEMKLPHKRFTQRQWISRRWFQIFFICFALTWGDDPIWLIFFK